MSRCGCWARRGSPEHVQGSLPHGRLHRSTCRHARCCTFCTGRIDERRCRLLGNRLHIYACVLIRLSTRPVAENVMHHSNLCSMFFKASFDGRNSAQAVRVMFSRSLSASMALGLLSWSSGVAR